VSPYLASFMTGSVEVVCGPMFSGKTEELIRRVRRAQIAKQKIQIFKPEIDDRYHETKVVSHSSQSVAATPVASAVDILRRIYDSTRIVAIDEVQFFDENLIKDAINFEINRAGQVFFVHNRIENITNRDPQGTINTVVSPSTMNIQPTAQDIARGGGSFNQPDGSGGYTGGFDSSTQNYNDPYSPGDTE